MPSIALIGPALDPRRCWLLVPLLVLLAGALGGCGGDDDQGANKGDAKRALNPGDNARARRLVLRLSDFPQPADWRADIDKKDEDSSSTKCGTLSFSDLTLTGRADA